MRKLNTARYSPVARTGAFLLCLVLLSACFWLSFVTLLRWDDIWLGNNYYRSSTAQQEMYNDRYRVLELLSLRQRKEWEGKLTYSEQEQLKSLENSFAPSLTNFRFEVHDQAGTLLLDNLDGKLLEDETPAQHMYTNRVELGERYYHNDYTEYNSETGTYFKMIYTGDGYLPCNPADSINQYNQYGYLSDGENLHSYDSSYDSRVRSREFVIEYGIAASLPVQDQYSDDMKSYERIQGILPTVAFLALVTLLSGIALLVFLCSAVGRQEDGTIALRRQDRIPYDLYLALDLLLFTVLISAGEAITYGVDTDLNRPVVMGLGVFTLAFTTLAVWLVITTAVRLKSHTLLRNTLLARCLRGTADFLRRVFRGLPITKRMIFLFFLYLLGTVLTTLTIILIPIYQGFVLWCLCRWVRQWRAIREATARIVGGEPDFKINAKNMYPDLKEHAEQLNDLGGAIGSAVDEQLRSERFKAELITNVSHDLKTPLTSIINYVGLLKKIPLDNPQAAEYIDVLDRKSQRLKKLTEDLVDASKASTGTLNVNLERLGMGQLICQALGEYEEKFAAQELEVVFSLPADELYVWADGRHLWRVIDNLFANCAKYAMERTRIYLEVRRWEGNIFFSVKNISRQALNVPPEQLMERFVRGEESRTTEGSGLGLSIARSLTDLQGGTFRLDIDGDLFKATLSFPEACALTDPILGNL